MVGVILLPQPVATDTPQQLLSALQLFLERPAIHAAGVAAPRHAVAVQRVTSPCFLAPALQRSCAMSVPLQE